MVPLAKYSGAGNDFIVLDGRCHDVSEYRSPERISSLCKRSEGFQGGADGMMILSEGRDGADFTMEYYNSDGSSGMMCGNGGRCIAAFAADIGIEPGDGVRYRFLSPDGVHLARLLSLEGRFRTVRLGMRDVTRLERFPDGYFLNTGTRHFVTFVPDVEKVDMETSGKAIRWREEFLPEGVNADFVQKTGMGKLKVRTFEKGVEAETLACGTGIVASAIAAWTASEEKEAKASFEVLARRDTLLVEFEAGEPGSGTIARNITLTGPTEKIC